MPQDLPSSQEVTTVVMKNWDPLLLAMDSRPGLHTHTHTHTCARVATRSFACWRF